MKKFLLFSLIITITGCTAVTSEPQATQTEIVAATPTRSEEKSVAATPTQSEKKPVEPSATADMAGQTPAAENADHLDLLNQLLFDISTREEGQAILDKIEASGDTRFVAGLIDILRYQRSLQREIGHTLNVLTGQELLPDWFEWVEWAGQHPEIESFDGYVGFKANLLAQIDPNFLRFIHDDIKIAPDSRVEEIVWGGVQVDSIPALDNPTMIDPAEATYLVPEERVFGVSINGDTRAYPARFLDWHEMFNDVVGGEPVSLAY
jgi:hypothetical protein